MNNANISYIIFPTVFLWYLASGKGSSNTLRIELEAIVHVCLSFNYELKN